VVVVSEASGPVRTVSGLTTLWAAIREVAIVVVLALGLATLVRVFLVQAFLIPSGSMEDTLQIGDRVLVSKLTTRLGEVQRGDVVVFSDPGSWLGPAPPGPDGVRGAVSDALQFVGVLPSDSEGHLIKRVVGVPGDRVVCCTKRGLLTVNGTPVDEREVLKPGVAASQQDFDVIVPESSYWLMGDNRPNSGDSRVHGAVPGSSVVGRAFVVVWPPTQWGAIQRPDTYAEVREPRGRPAPVEDAA
jgi:signal peptidase I